MSRLGKLPVSTQGVEVSLSGDVVSMKSPKGELSLVVPSVLTIEMGDNDLSVKREDTTESKMMQGTIRSRLNNMVIGLTEGYSKQLEFNGVGYSVSVAGPQVKMTLGYSHPVNEDIPKGLTCEAEGKVLTVAGFDKVLVGEFAAKIRSWRKPEPYLGKGIKYMDEHIVRKQGKKLGA